MVTSADTSVWIRFLAGRAPFLAQMDRLLERGQIAGHALVYGELLIGDLSGRAELLRAYRSIHQVPTVEHSDVVNFVRARRLHGQGIGWIDAHLLASVLVTEVQLWTADGRLQDAAMRLRIAYVPAA